MARVLFVEPFYSGSHRAVADGFQRHSRHDVRLLTLPGHSWRQRMRRGAIELTSEALALERAPDVLVTTDMLDLPLFLALTRPRFSATPTLLFMHENQLTYPRLRETKINSWFGAINFTSALAATSIRFNSQYHLRSFLAALRTLAAQPTNWLHAPGIDCIDERSSVLPVGIELRDFDARQERTPADVPTILWNHRWEFDKAPALFVRALAQLAGEGLDFRVAIAGEPGLNPHPALVGIADKLPGRVVHHGFAESREAYGTLLRSADIVVSTARHEFFGIGMVEAMYCGAVPLAPNDLAYPEVIAPDLHGPCLFTGEADLIERLRALLLARSRGDLRERARASAERFDWSRIAPLWDTEIDVLAAA